MCQNTVPQSATSPESDKNPVSCADPGLGFGSGAQRGLGWSRYSRSGFDVNTQQSRHIVVVGAGILGACIAWRISEKGFPVTLIDKSDPGSGASSHSFAKINTDAKIRSPEPMKL